MRIKQTATLVMVLVLTLLGTASSQTASGGAFPGTTVSFNLSPISLPGLATTIAGAETDFKVKPSPYFSFGPTTLLSSQMTFVGGRGDYILKPVSNFIQAHSPNLNGYQFQFGVTASVGVVKPVGSVGGAHWGERAGIFLNYAINNVWGMGAEAQYGNFVGIRRNTMTLAFGPSFHF